MNYSAKTVYRDDAVADAYEQHRFQTWKGRKAGDLETQRMVSGLKRLGVKPQGVVVDVPAGTGRLSRRLLDEGFRAVGMDISSAMLRQGFALHGLGGDDAFIGATSADVEHLPLATASVDAVVSLRLMGHLPPATKERAVAEMLRVARVGAVVMFVRRTGLLRLKRQAMWTIGARPKAAHWFDETDQEIRELIERAGGEVAGYEDLLGPFAESRAYSIRHQGRH